MKRRSFIKVMGAGSSVVLVPSVLGACGTLRATDAWKGPDRDQKDIRWIVLSYAILAPNPHNKQPWIIKLTGPGSFDLFVDQRRLLPQTDPPHRQIHIGQGTFLENLDLAARQFEHRATIATFPAGMYGNDTVADKPVASINLARDPSVRKDPLFDQIRTRQTNKRAFSDSALRNDQLRRLVDVGTGDGCRMTAITDRGQRKELTTLLTEAMRVEISNKKRHAETVAMFRFDDEEMEQKRDGFGLAQSGVTGFKKWFVEAFILSRDSAIPADSSFAEATIELTTEQAETAPAFGLITSRGNTRLDQVNVGRVYERVALAASALGIATHPMSQILEEYSDMDRLRQRLRSHLAIPPGETPQMLFRLGRADRVSPSPRRRVTDLVAG